LGEEARTAVEAHNRILEEWYEKINGFISLGTPEGMVTNRRMHSGQIDGEFIDFVVPATATDFPVVHGLGRVPLGFIEIGPGAEDRLHRVAATPAHTSDQLWVRTSAAAGTIYRIWVF
jgi:hypothetical protein